MLQWAADGEASARLDGIAAAAAIRADVTLNVEVRPQVKSDDVSIGGDA
jgi:hypothetical protein